ncbi:MAG TPA: hypothetical protein DIT07_16580 [Sphingobacteriaceae bacterium]|nr:hypothetical protein [Sphingobacteriaceae bacterium]
MESAILSGKSKKDLQLLVELAEKLGIKARILSAEEKEDLVLGKAIKEGRTGEIIDTDEFLKSLK